MSFDRLSGRAVPSNHAKLYRGGSSHSSIHGFSWPISRRRSSCSRYSSARRMTSSRSCSSSFSLVTSCADFWRGLPGKTFTRPSFSSLRRWVATWRSAARWRARYQVLVRVDAFHDGPGRHLGRLRQRLQDLPLASMTPGDICVDVVDRVGDHRSAAGTEQLQVGQVPQLAQTLQVLAEVADRPRAGAENRVAREEHPSLSR
jgi:hypothetical protein